ncbi:hypothetical protein [Streptomyces neyagawaensis]|uniref:hypothetical protein n=1 Tax=Streptomyces neyagawaensis TaxID=42238 RepID=UPI0006E28520|nr:hypothetical protein [Streptomyces neyagawaensis]MCL6731072.1 hypothetical protein [Streptomyces neyagawaensis]MDE1686206.1 hypothetical protein [Streptomyces neyagawaensis]
MHDRRHDAVLAFADEADPEGAEEAVALLVEELSQLDVSSVRHQTAGPAPGGTRAGEAVIYTTVLVSATGAAGLKALLALAQDWLARRNSGSIDVTIDGDELHLTSASRADQRRAIELFAARHAPGPVGSDDSSDA